MAGLRRAEASEGKASQHIPLCLSARRSAQRKEGSHPDDRTRLWRGALVVARGLLAANDKRPIEVYDGADVWIIPMNAVRWVRLHDPESPDRRGAEIGFRMGGEEPA